MAIRRLAVVVVALAAAAAAAAAQDSAKKDAAKTGDTAKTEPTPEELAKKLDGVLDDLSKRLGAMKTLRCNFEQKKYLEVFEDVVTSQGTLALAVPDKLRWEYVKPVKSVLTVNGRQAMRAKTSRKGVTTRTTFCLDDEPVTAITTQQVFLWSRGDFAKARDGYDLALVTEKPLVVRATPKEERLKKIVASIDLTFSYDRNLLTGVTLVEKSDAKTVISFQDVEVDPELAETVFQIDK